MYVYSNFHANALFEKKYQNNHIAIEIINDILNNVDNICCDKMQNETNGIKIDLNFDFNSTHTYDDDDDDISLISFNSIDEQLEKEMGNKNGHQLTCQDTIIDIMCLLYTNIIQ
jgi:hypothetical protein